MQAFLVYTKSTRVSGQVVNQELKKVPVEDGVADSVSSTRDFIIGPDGALCKVLEKIVDLPNKEVRILVRAQ